MNLDWQLIISFIQQRWNVKKKDIANMLNYAPSELSRKQPIICDPDIAYNKLFNVKNKESLAYGNDESDILGALKDFIRKAKLENSLEDVWDKEYSKFVIEMLNRANTQIPEDKTENILKNETLSEQMLYTFNQAIDYYHIKKFMEINPNNFYYAIPLCEDLSSQVVTFIADIQSDIVESFKSVESDSKLMYINIKTFIIKLTKYNEDIKKAPLPTYRPVNHPIFHQIFNNEEMSLSPSSIWEKEIDNLHEQINFYYKKICGSDIL